MSDLRAWESLWAKEPKLRPEHLYVGSDGLCWLASSAIVEPNVAADLILAAAVRWLATQCSTIEVSYDTKAMVWHLAAWMGGKFYADTLLDVLRACCERVLEKP